MISKKTEAHILRLYHGEKWPIGTIAAQLGVYHTTVQRVLHDTGVEAKVVAPRPSMAAPFVPFITELLGKYPRLRASRLFAMVQERGYRGGPEHFRRIVARHRPPRPAEAFQRLRMLPGEQAQVDWAHFGKLAVGRALRPLWAFVMVLSYSRRLFVQFLTRCPTSLRSDHDGRSERSRWPEMGVTLAEMRTTPFRRLPSTSSAPAAEVARPAAGHCPAPASACSTGPPRGRGCSGS